MWHEIGLGSIPHSLTSAEGHILFNAWERFPTVLNVNCNCTKTGLSNSMPSPGREGGKSLSTPTPTPEKTVLDGQWKWGLVCALKDL